MQELKRRVKRHILGDNDENNLGDHKPTLEDLMCVYVTLDVAIEEKKQQMREYEAWLNKYN